MAEVVWTEPALSDLDAIADYIALENSDAARELVQRLFHHVGQVGPHPQSGSQLLELRGWGYRQIVEPRLHPLRDAGRAAATAKQVKIS